MGPAQSDSDRRAAGREAALPLERKGVGRDSVRVALVVVQAMFRQAVRWGWTQVNPVQYVEKPSARRERAVVCLSPDKVE